MSLEWSKGKRRPSSRTAGGDVPALPTLESAETGPMNDPSTGRFVKGNRAHRRRQVKSRAQGIATLNPRTVPSWLMPFVADGVRLAQEFSARFPDDPALRPLIGACVDAWVVFRALLALGSAGDTAALSEARAWLREHRQALTTLSALAGELRDERRAASDPHAALAAILTVEKASDA